MDRRPAARLLIVDRDGRVLLFRYRWSGTIAGRTVEDHWGLPGGRVEDGETFEQAAARELKEETGIDVSSVGTWVARREFVLGTPDGREMMADEQYFRVDVDSPAISEAGRTEHEAAILVDHRWWSAEDLAGTAEMVWPEDLVELIARTGGE